MILETITRLNPFRYFASRLCPFCFETIKLREAPFRCGNRNCKPAVDPIRASEWGEGTPIGQLIEPAGIGSRFQGVFRKARQCAACGQVSRIRSCPHCHQDLPFSFGDFPNYIIAVIGAKDSGKSHYLAVLIQELRRRIGLDFDVVLSALDDQTTRRYEKEFKSPVYTEGRIIQTTKSGLGNNAVRRPLLYSLTFKKRPWYGGDAVPFRAVTLVFFDTAGEDLVSQNTMKTVNKYIYRSNGIILLVDPLQLGTVRSKLSGTPMPEMADDAADILERTTRLIEEGRGYSPSDQIPIPMALSFSKFDAVETLVDSQFQLLATANHAGEFDQVDFDAINTEMQDLLKQWDCQHLVNLASSRYRKAGFFGLSALGCNPHASQRIPDVMPRRVEDPFLWLLRQNHLIPGPKTPNG